MRRGSALTLTLLLVMLLVAGASAADDHPLPQPQREKLMQQLDATIQRRTQLIAAEPRTVGHYSHRGDALFFRARFQEAVSDYEKMVELDRKLDSSHWRRGIAYFYAGQFEQAAHQFENYNTIDDVDRENGIWRFFSQSKASGLKKARASLLKYRQDDREPFPSLYRLFSRETTPAAILQTIAAAKIDGPAREKRHFYAHLYIGLNDAITGNGQLASCHLRKAIANTWAPTAGFGPNYMWHVGRLHYELMAQRPAKTRTPDSP